MSNDTAKDVILDVRADFDLPPDRVWLNTAHQGALPTVSAAAAREVIRWKLRPHEMTGERFASVPGDLKRSIGRLIGVPSEEVILANGASYGLHLLANGVTLEPGDEVLLMSGDFPSNVLPWRDAASRGVAVREIAPEDNIVSVQEVRDALSARTKVVCLSWVHSFSGRVIDIASIGRLCRENGTWLIVNASQGLGVLRLRVPDYPIDALVCAGWKWLCGPYGTGFAWIRKPLLRDLRYNQAYWLAAQDEASLRDSATNFTVPPVDDARRYDVFGTANFFNFAPLAASLNFLHELGEEQVEHHVRGLVTQLVEGLDPERFEVVSHCGLEQESSLVVIQDRDPVRQQAIYRKAVENRIDLALRNGKLRISPHLYNLPADIDRTLSLLNERV